jgi:hypothetical protein
LAVLWFGGVGLYWWGVRRERAEVAAASLGRRLAVARAWIDARAAEEALVAADGDIPAEP